MANQERNQERVDRIVAARAKLLKRVKAHPKHEMGGRWKAKIAEYEQSLRNFHEFKQEVKPTGNLTAVNISVPLSELGIKEFPPEG